MEDRELRLGSGWMGLVWVLALLAANIGLIAVAVQWGSPQLAWVIVVLWVVWVVSLAGFIVNGPNQARVVQLFGKYVGTVKETGFFYGNPFYWRTRVSLRVRTFETGMTRTEAKRDAATGQLLQQASQHRQPIKVNDADGTPIEISAAVLQRQQAAAIIAARAQIVTGAVGIVEHALEMLQERNVIELDGERRAAMVSNLLVVLCGHNVPQPVLNTGTLYT